MRIIVSIVVLLISLSAIAQRDLTPTKKSQAFGSRDFRSLNNYGIQFEIGPTYTITRLDKNNRTTMADFSIDSVNGQYTHDPNGLVGFYAEIGMAHFPKKRSKLSLWLKTVLVSYYDWGIGYKHIGGTETTTVDRLDAAGNIIGTEEYSGKFYNGHAYARFSIHKNINLGKKFFIDNGLGLNVDYKVVHGAAAYAGEVYPGRRSLYNPLSVQLHYSIGFGIKLKRGSYLIPGVRTPIVGYQSTSSLLAGNGKGTPQRTVVGNPAFQWFSSKYWPIYPHIKFIYLLEKKAKGCPPVETNDQDKETQRNR